MYFHLPYRQTERSKSTGEKQLQLQLQYLKDIEEKGTIIDTDSSISYYGMDKNLRSKLLK